ncbi:MAG: hypothetical protein JO058_09485, partial [Alphaproteobacteria bacterium]|nr:hypothetical protein [Alphaproteobacteria bacterium]
FAAAAARGCLAGAAAEAGFCLAYGVTARGKGWAGSIAAGTLGFAACAAVLQTSAPPLWLLAPIVYAALAAALWLMPQLAQGRAQLPVPPAWDLPARMIVATALVLVLTEVPRSSARGPAAFWPHIRCSGRCWRPLPTI